jgi:hypothetical protein
LYRDDIFLRALPLPHLDNLVVAERLHVEALHFDVHSLVYDKLPIIGVKSHNHLHSRRVGYVLGELIRDGPTGERVQYIRGLIQPADADDGEPVAAGRYAGWLERAEAAFTHAGWSLEKASVELSEEAPAPINRMWDVSPPDLALRVQSSDRTETWGETDTAQNCRRATWEPDIFVYEGKGFVLDVRDGKDILARSLGGRTLTADESLPTHLPADPEGGVFWSGDFEWQPMHY